MSTELSGLDAFGRRNLAIGLTDIQRAVVIERLNRYTVRVMRVPALGECIESSSQGPGDAYSSVYIFKMQVGAHRWAYLAHNGPLDPALNIDHLCRNRRCRNAAHLEQVTPKVNVLRGISPVAENANKSICKRGHPFSPDNTYFRSCGQRECKVCRKAAWDEVARRRKAARLTARLERKARLAK